MSNKDFIPQADATFEQWQNVLITYLIDNAERLGLPPAAVENLQMRQAAWRNTYATAENPATRTAPAVLAKNEARTAFIGELRPFLKSYITFNLGVSNEERRDMGLPVHDNKPTPTSSITRMPIGEIDFSVHQRHTVRVKDDSLTGKGKPEHARGYEVWHRVGGNLPTSDADFTYAGFSSSATLVIDYLMEDVGKTVWYRVRWLNTRNEPSPWSEIFEAVIA